MNRVFTFSVCLGLSGVLMAETAKPPATAKPAPSSSGKDLCKQNFDTYRDKLRKNPDDGPTWTELRVCADLLKRWGEAGAIATGAIERGLKRPEPHLILGQAYYSAKDYTHAVDEFREAIRLKDDHAHAYFQLGLAYLHLSQPSDAVGVGVRAVELEPNNPAYHRQLAFSYFMTQQDEKCEVEAKKTLELDPNDVAAYKILSNLYTRQGKQDLADHMLEESIHANGRMARANPFVPDKQLSELEMPKYFQISTPPSDTEIFLKAQWERMKQRALTGDVEATVSFYSTHEARDIYRQALQRMGPQRMREVYGKLGELSDCAIDPSNAHATCRCPVTGKGGTLLETKVQFEKNADNIWRIVSF